MKKYIYFLILICGIVILLWVRFGPEKEDANLGMKLPFRNVARFHDSALFCNFHLGIQVMEVSCDENMSSILYRYNAKPIFPTGPVAVRPDGNRFYICTENELLEFDRYIRLIRRIPISAFNFGQGDYIYAGTLRASNDTLWMTIQLKQNDNKKHLNTNSFIVQWRPNNPILSRIIGPYVSSPWDIDIDSHKVFVVKPKASIYDFTTQTQNQQSWGDYSYVDYDKDYGILLSNRPEGENELIVRVDPQTGSQVPVSEGAWAKWGPDGYIYFVRGQSQLWRCRYDGNDLCPVYLASRSKNVKKVFLPSFVFSCDQRFLSFFYHFLLPSGNQKRGIVLIDLVTREYRELHDVGFRTIAWIMGERQSEKAVYPKISPTFLGLSDAVFFWEDQTVELLIEQGADVNEQDNLGNTPMHYAAELGRKDILEIFIAKGANVNVRNKNGTIPLHKAVEGPIYNYRKISTFSSDRLGSVRILLDAGSNPNMKNEFGITPLDIAERNRQIDIIKLLKQFQNIK